MRVQSLPANGQEFLCRRKMSLRRQLAERKSDSTIFHDLPRKCIMHKKSWFYKENLIQNECHADCSNQTTETKGSPTMVGVNVDLAAPLANIRNLRLN